jgi:Domain of unknown function (DUF5664)
MITNEKENMREKENKIEVRTKTLFKCSFCNKEFFEKMSLCPICQNNKMTTRTHEQKDKKEVKLPLADIIIEFREAIVEVGKVWVFGKQKYSEERNPAYTLSNWKVWDKGEQEFRNAAIRHILASVDDAYDSESGLLHLAHAAFCVLALLIHFIRNIKRNIN